MDSQAEYDTLKAEIRELEQKVRNQRQPTDADIQRLGRIIREATLMGQRLSGVTLPRP